MTTLDDLPRAPDRWLQRGEMTRNTWGWEPGKLFLGTLPGDPSVRVGRADDRHVVTLAGSRAGKSSTAILPNLKTWPGSVLCIDPKGELAMASRAWRERFGRVVVLDPFNVTGERAAHAWNPFDELRAAPPELVVDEAASLAAALITEPAGAREPYWTDQARAMVQGLALHSLGWDTPTLAGLRSLLTSGNALPELFRTMAKSGAHDGVVRNIGASLAGLEGKQLDTIVATATSQTGFLDSPGVRAVSSRSTFSLADFKEPSPLSVFLVLPSGRMPTHARWLRLFISLALSAMETLPGRPPSPVLWVLEEFAQLGHMRDLAAAAGYMAGFDVRLWVVLQDLSQLKANYRESWETFLGNAGLLQAFGNSDQTTLEYLSRRLGEVDVILVDREHASLSAMHQGGTGERIRHERRPLLAPDELALLFARERRSGLILAAGQKPLVVERVTVE